MAFAVGDDDAITHGTPEQRKRWFMNGFKDGNVGACDTLSASPRVGWRKVTATIPQSLC